MLVTVKNPLKVVGPALMGMEQGLLLVQQGERWLQEVGGSGEQAVQFGI